MDKGIENHSRNTDESRSLFSVDESTYGALP